MGVALPETENQADRSGYLDRDNPLVSPDVEGYTRTGLGRLNLNSRSSDSGDPRVYEEGRGGTPRPFAL